MTIYDANASVGSWPFRSHPTRTAAQLVARMDEVGIARAVVASLAAVCYRDCQAGTDDMLAEIAPYRDRFTPFAVLNPLYAGWERDLRACHEQHGCRGVRMYPNYHGYSLVDPAAQRLIGACAERGLVVAFVCRLEDRRQRFRLDTPEDITLDEIAAGLRPHPNARFLILEGLGIEHSVFATEPLWRERPFAVEMSRTDVVLRRGLPRLLEVVGSEKVVFGTGLPLKGPHSALLKLQLLEVDDATRQAIASGNLTRLLGEPAA